ncbi:hypothetical protein NW806_05730 [Synechococcus sp. W65.1]|uniref:hypothetical protein n=1 Tax=Synechococcus sp. W65.1 TaxID=2964526 RepID=UPI0039C4573E
MLDRWLAGVPGLDPICRPSAQGSPVGGFELEAWLVTPREIQPRLTQPTWRP